MEKETDSLGFQILEVPFWPPPMIRIINGIEYRTLRWKSNIPLKAPGSNTAVASTRSQRSLPGEVDKRIPTLYILGCW